MKVEKFIKRKVKYLIKRVSGRFNHLKKSINCNKKWYGNNYGGFYVCPEYINENSIVYSFGIGEDISFDIELIEKHNCNVFGFDPTPKSINWVKSQRAPRKFKFYEYGISDEDGFVSFYLPKNTNHVSGSIVKHQNVNQENKIKVEMKSLKSILIELNHNHIDILKMDIEGEEYGVINNILTSKIPITQILVEFHERFLDKGKEKTKYIIKQMQEKGFEIFGISDTFEEISFINKNMLQQKI